MDPLGAVELADGREGYVTSAGGDGEGAAYLIDVGTPQGKAPGLGSTA